MKKQGFCERKTTYLWRWHPPAAVIAIAAELSSPAYYFGKEYSIKREASTWSICCGDRQINNLPNPSIQLKSAAAAITACILLEDYLPVSSQHFQAAMHHIFIPGRSNLKKGW